MGLASKTQVVKFIRKGEKGDTGAKGDKGDTGATGDRGPVMRGPQLWASVETGYSFESGAEGESWKDVVVYNGNYYYCKASHTKTETNYPGSSTGDYLWQLGDKVGLVATDLLIASDALVENLTANYLTMKNSAGEVVFEAKDGEVTCKTGTFENVTVHGYLQTTFKNIEESDATIVTHATYGQCHKIGNDLNLTAMLNDSPYADTKACLEAYVMLPSAAEYIGRRVILYNSMTPPFTRTGMLCHSVVFPEDGFFLGVTTELSTSSKLPYQIEWICGAVELLGVPSTTSDGNTGCGWLVMSISALSVNYQYNS